MTSNLPASWRVARLGFTVETHVPQRDKPDPLTGPIPWVRIEDFVGQEIRKSKSGQGVTQEQVRLMNLRVYSEGTVLCSCSCSMGATAIVREPLVSNQTFIGLTPGPDIESRFLFYLMNAMQDELQAHANGAIQQYLSRDDFRSLRIPLAPLEEQRRIADFLDAETARIDRLINLRKRQQQLVFERSEAVVSSFFSRGEGQREYRFRDLMQSNPCYGVLVPKFSDVGVPLIRVSDLGKLDHDLERLPKVEEDQAREYRRTRISPGDLLITVVGATIGRCDVAPEAADGFNVSRALARVQLLSGLSPQMIAAWVRGRDFHVQAELATSGAAAQPALNMSDITHFSIWLPESNSGRSNLARRVSAHEHRIRSLRSVLERQLNLSAERRQALITDAVTGQFDVSTASGRNVTDGVHA